MSSVIIDINIAFMLYAAILMIYILISALRLGKTNQNVDFDGPQENEFELKEIRNSNCSENFDLCKISLENNSEELLRRIRDEERYEEDFETLKTLTFEQLFDKNGEDF
ncbi:hypothetical protein MHBO_001877 [Bonamia ostreae]|uniref:ATP synthase F0 subunit 8 n=1 Tax=Bonamia ostreae TaxID=126728 RepID=A0ABV2AKG4_9EUKA